MKLPFSYKPRVPYYTKHNIFQVEIQKLGQFYRTFECRAAYLEYLL